MIAKMLLIRNIIEMNISTNDWLGKFETLVLEIEDNIENEPDISIESSKSLLESVAKNILCRLDPTYSEKKANETGVTKLLKDAKVKLLENSLEGDEVFISGLISAVTFINKLRNDRGDISHGKTLPKENRSSIHLAITIKSFTDTLASHLLYLLLSIDLSYQEKLKYEDNPDFNNFLDELKPIVGISYSKALFDQDPVSYAEELSDYQNDIEPE